METRFIAKMPNAHCVGERRGSSKHQLNKEEAEKRRKSLQT